MRRVRRSCATAIPRRHLQKTIRRRFHTISSWGSPSPSAGGIISEVACSKTQGLKFTLISKPKNLHFYTDNYFDVAFRAANFTPKGVMNPCSDLEGMQARIIYRPVKGSPDEGQLVEVQLTR